LNQETDASPWEDRADTPTMKRQTPLRHSVLRAAAFLTAAVTDASAQRAATTDAVEQRAIALLELSIEELGRVLVTSVSRREEAAMDAPAAVFVITRADILTGGRPL
jgi:hypothetical protein